tara:strand:+ start:1518 stop:2423 length:906 start_codon:yes stop_codon:yes gene_type:complete
MKILILGLNSQVSNTIKKNESTLNKKGFEIYYLDRTYLDLNKLYKAIFEIEPEVIINSFVYHPVDDCEKNKKLSYNVNYLFIKKLITILNLSFPNIFFIHLSSDYVFDGKKKQGSYLDNEKRNPLNVLGQHKQKSEDYLIDNYKKVVIVRTSWLFSEFNNNFVVKIFKKLKEQKSIAVVSDQFGNPTSANSLIIFIFDYLIKQNNNITKKIYNFCNYPSVSWHIFAENIFNILFSKKIIKKNLYIDEMELAELKKINYFAKRPINSSMLIKNIEKDFKTYKKVYWYIELEKIIKILIKNAK